MVPNRNEPCPCGSGRKYKKCHGAVTAEVRQLDAFKARLASLKQLEMDSHSRILQFALASFGRDWLAQVIDEYTGESHERLSEAEQSFAIVWGLYHRVDRNRFETVGERFLAELGKRMAADERNLFEAKVAAWLSMWEVQHVDKGKGLQLLDMLTAESRYVHDVAASQSASTRDVMLARIATVDDISIFDAVHPQMLPPRDGALVAATVRKRARVRTRPVKFERLRVDDLVVDLIDEWRWHLRTFRERSPMPTMTNTDGDIMSSTVDHFRYDQSVEEEITRRLGAIEDFDGPQPEGADTVFVALRAGNKVHANWPNTVIGLIRLRNGTLRVETNSVERADAMRKRVEQILHGLATWRIREEHNLDAELLHRQSRTGGNKAQWLDEDDVPPEIRSAMRDMRQNMMDNWPDEHVPALGGKTPRDAVKTASGRRDVEALLRDFEHNEGRKPEEDRIDIGRLRNKLEL